MQALTIGGKAVRCDDAGLVSLTDLYAAAEAAGSATGKRNPSDWSREAGAQFIDFVAGQLNTRKSGIYVSRRGKGGGTFAHWQIALAYAKYLSSELHMQVNEVYARAKAGDVTLADEIADKASPEQQEWLAKRVNSKVARHRLTSILASHGVSGRGFGDCTNNTYKGLFNGTKKEICAAAGIEYKKNKSLRDVMSVEDLVTVSMAEIVAAKQIDKFNVRGNAACADECLRSARKVAGLLQ
ncbi:kilA-N domain protein [Burkholderia thailandensis MSMB59]|uniref:KilA-N domain-containing protein n=1 Tax=pseudomallei group TaxID=111527 RepID=UPI00051548A1|nr:KilA-N domain-containing protein [Burkholderia thailandensis]AIS94396.1 kilA-N domain protein [Burkholderia thailandensis MSMB59]